VERQKSIMGVQLKKDDPALLPEDREHILLAMKGLEVTVMRRMDDGFTELRTRLAKTEATVVGLVEREIGSSRRRGVAWSAAVVALAEVAREALPILKEWAALVGGA
jgi:hypothetical protein